MKSSRGCRARKNTIGCGRLAEITKPGTVNPHLGLHENETAGRWGSVIELLVLQTSALQQKGDTPAALKMLERDGDTLWVISWRDRNWWKNLRVCARVRVLLAGESVEGHGLVIKAQKPVAQSLFDYYSKVPQVAKYAQIALDAAGKPVVADCERAAQK